MTQPWVLSLFFDCENAGMRAWPEIGEAGTGAGFGPGSALLHCPNASTVAAVKSAIQRGDIFMHAFPHNGEAGYYPDSSLFEAALAMAETLSKELDIPPPTAVSQRDVPGFLQ